MGFFGKAPNSTVRNIAKVASNNISELLHAIEHLPAVKIAFEHVDASVLADEFANQFGLEKDEMLAELQNERKKMETDRAEMQAALEETRQEREVLQRKFDETIAKDKTNKIAFEEERKKLRAESLKLQVQLEEQLKANKVYQAQQGSKQAEFELEMQRRLDEQEPNSKHRTKFTKSNWWQSKQKLMQKCSGVWTSQSANSKHN